ncbi:FmdE family protein [Pseudodesulfovibrio sediminis]|uniref:Molybdenum formylmethanofuran dehydrogenas e subunit fmde related n=1 Tax=Pseudodesulfovibrio sediminis TaxID=2810563 RepID=A0ABN6ESB0_9BACT|nr:FmdE family protein [Pseudodesulfovibrio sediminis]BCS88120.1 molybdenum formylmethanofuran dehydrogenas e subunit fmde related [Pseudodesulfovibrio sediminis]
MTMSQNDLNTPTVPPNFYSMENSSLRDSLYETVIHEDRMACLLRVGEFHGHLCPGIALGIMSTLTGLREMGILHAVNNGMEDMLAIVETNACFTDGVQYISGCTLGNNALIYRDFGKTAVTFALRSRSLAVRVRVTSEYARVIAEGSPDFFPLMEKVVRDRSGSGEDEAAFMRAGRQAAVYLINQTADRFLSTAIVEPLLPPYAPITETLVCSACGEPFMATKGVSADGKILCRACAGHAHPQVEGGGILSVPPADEGRASNFRAQLIK